MEKNSSGQQNLVQISIPTTHQENDVTYYDIHIKLPYKNYTILRRFNEFQTLKQNLEILRLNNKLPYQLPSKFQFWSSNEKIVETRKLQLCKFLTDLIQDKNLRSNSLVLEFLNLPKTIFMTQDMPLKDDWAAAGGSAAKIDINNWEPQLKNVTNSVKNMMTKVFNNGDSAENSLDSTEMRARIFSIKKELEELSKSLTSHELSLGAGELRRRVGLLSLSKRELYELESMMKDRLRTGQASSATSERQQLLNTSTSSKRVLGKLRETATTLPLNNAELFQQQQMQLKLQDQDVEHIRNIVRRQREIAVVINNEVNEQNEFLDDLNQQVDDSSDKMRTAKKMINRIR